MNGKVKTTLGLNNYWGTQSYFVFMSLLEDNMKPVVEEGNLIYEYVYNYSAMFQYLIDTYCII